MKIDPQHIAPDAGSLTRVDATSPRATRGPSTEPAGRTDSVDVSAATALQRVVTQAVEAALTGPETRPDAVERGRALVESGELGRDAGALADAIIDSLLEQP